MRGLGIDLSLRQYRPWIIRPNHLNSLNLNLPLGPRLSLLPSLLAGSWSILDYFPQRHTHYPSPADCKLTIAHNPLDINN